MSDRFSLIANALALSILLGVAGDSGRLAAAQPGEAKTAFDSAMAEVAKSAKGGAVETKAMERAIAAARALKSPLAVPDAVIDHLGRAKAAAQAAKSPRDFLDAANAFGEAARLAPWIAEYHFNRGVVLEKAEQYDQAEEAFGLYLKAAPGAKDSNEVRERIAGLKYLKEKTERAKTEPAPASPEDMLKAEKDGMLRSLNGLYYNDGEFNNARTTELMGHASVGVHQIANGRMTCGVLYPHNPNFTRKEGFFPYKDGAFGILANTSVALDGHLVTFCDNSGWCDTGAETGYTTSRTIIIAKDGESLKEKLTNCASQPDYRVYQRH